jgi:hypothetical protein
MTCRADSVPPSDRVNRRTMAVGDDLPLNVDTWYFSHFKVLSKAEAKVSICKQKPDEDQTGDLT